MSVLDRSALEASPLADLHAIASELSIDGYRRLRRPGLVTAILAKQAGEPVPAAEDEPPSGPPRRATRSRRTTRAAEESASEKDADEASPEAAGEEEPSEAGSDSDSDETPARPRGRRGG
ncbi:MAG: Rho termination factor N-terminal domain-containing protein, partial [Solirubrobacteraceae bacterium]